MNLKLVLNYAQYQSGDCVGPIRISPGSVEVP